jgi:indole-3-acetate monooxygenase
MPMDQLVADDPNARARALRPELLAAADEIERIQDFPEPLISHMHDARLFQLLLPRSVGGVQTDPTTYLRALIEVAQGDGSVAWNMFVANSACLLAPFLPLESARTIYASPRAQMAWGFPAGQTADVVDGGYRVSGRWDFASGSRQATWMGAHGFVREKGGSLRLNERGTPLVRSWLFPAEQAELLDNWNPVGLKGTCSQSYNVNDVFVPEEFSSTREYPELRQEPGPLYAIPQQGLYAVGVAGVALGLARAMLDGLLELAMEKVPRGRPRMAEDKLVQAGYARAEAKWGSAMAYLEATIQDIYGNADEWDVIAFPERGRLRLACSNAIHASLEVADRVHKEAGVSAIFPGSPFDRRWRDIHTVSQQIQARGAHFEAIGSIMMGEPPEVFF